MNGDVNMRRSQVILRLPVDNMAATLTLHDGERSNVLLFIPPGEALTALVSPGDPFVPMIKDARFCLVARDAIAAIGVTAEPEVTDDGALPVERQRARVRLRSGAQIEGELRWTAPEGERRTADYVNDDQTFIVLHAAETSYYVRKAEIATVEEL